MCYSLVFSELWKLIFVTMKRFLLSAIVGWCCYWMTGFAAAANLENGERLFQACAVCHGEKGGGNIVLQAPVTAGQDAWYVIRQMQDFKTGRRGNDPRDKLGEKMRLMAMSLTDEGIEDVAMYVATLRPPQLERTVDGDAAHGKALFDTCRACHGDEAQGIEAANAPPLRYQFDWYLVRQLENFKDGIRGAHPESTFSPAMRPIVQLLANEQNIRDVVSYIATIGAD